MSDTPRTDGAYFKPHATMYDLALIECELNVANERIKRLQAVTNDPHALWANWLRGSVALPVGIGDVREYQERIKRLEEAGNEMAKWLDRNTPVTVRHDWLAAKEAKL